MLTPQAYMKNHTRIIENEEGVRQITSYEIRDENKEKNNCPSYSYNGHVVNCQCRQCTNDDFR